MRPECNMLDCPACGRRLIAALDRGRYDHDGNLIEHRKECRCRWCKWLWFDDRKPAKCKCGARVGVGIDDGKAYAKIVGEP